MNKTERIKKLIESVKNKKEKNQISAHQFKEVYKELDIDLNKLGCIMIDTEPIICEEILENEKDWCYKTSNKDRFWIDGYVSDKTPHITLKYGLLEPGKKWKKYVDTVLKDWNIKEVKIKEFGVFNSPYEDDPYFCIVGKIEVNDNLLEGHNRLNMLPNVSTFDSYIPHVTIVYIKKDEELKKKILGILENKFKGKSLKTLGINYGGNENEN